MAPFCISIVIIKSHNFQNSFYRIFDVFLISARFIPSRALACCPDHSRIWLQPRQPSLHPARILPLRDPDSPQNDSGPFKTDFFHILIHFFSEAILRVLCGLRFSYSGALNSCKCPSYYWKTTHSVLLKSSHFKLFFL